MRKKRSGLCSWVRGVQEAYDSRRLADPEMERVRAHLSVCRACRKAFGEAEE